MIERTSSVIREVAAAHGVSVAEIRSPTRTANLFITRMIIAVRLRKELGLPIPQIARALNRSTSAAEYYVFPNTRAARRRRASAYMQARRPA